MYKIKKVKFNNQTQQKIKKLLQLQQIAIEKDLTTLLNKINKILYTYNQIWRNKMLSINKFDFTNYQFIEYINNKTCYKF